LIFSDAGGWRVKSQYSTIQTADVYGHDGRVEVIGRAADGVHIAVWNGASNAAGVTSQRTTRCCKLVRSNRRRHRHHHDHRAQAPVTSGTGPRNPGLKGVRSRDVGSADRDLAAPRS